MWRSSEFWGVAGLNGRPFGWPVGRNAWDCSGAPEATGQCICIETRQAVHGPLVLSQINLNEITESVIDAILSQVDMSCFRIFRLKTPVPKVRLKVSIRIYLMTLKSIGKYSVFFPTPKRRPIQKTGRRGYEIIEHVLTNSSLYFQNFIGRYGLKDSKYLQTLHNI